jgi:pimeloyl-ACP methyl ester carboxylesterase
LRANGFDHVLAPDTRGHGRSGHGPPGHCLDPVDLLRDLDAVFRVEVREPVLLVAHSFGCTLACLYAALRPERARMLVLIEPVIPLLHQARPEPAGLRQAMEAYDASLRRQQHPTLPSLDTAVQLVAREYPSLDAAACAELAKRVLQRVDGGFRWTWDPAMREFERFAAPFLEGPTLSDWIGGLVMPVEFFVANESPFPTLADAQFLARRLRNGSIHRYSGSHQLHVEAPELIVQAIRRRSNGASSHTHPELQNDLRP